ncbi:hypothetical protein SAMN06893096_10997 [Geodermatophilus pulveris]|uniref:Tissue inhibitor of metalloproteinase n=1 Tax=Geodermatophilus pulveris TaxID=1564159 RepID=A0A239HXA9_9ACTN|nr:hypothetical protein [Geodermatophilus pulveris]SNS86020.1 hypothetical protein SAMN06893096_10997 [Geodermatophilus pulveris]
MRRATTGLLAGLLLVLAGWVLAPAASACGCTGGTSTELALRADAVFSGRLESREVAGDTALHVFRVGTVYTGRVAARQGVLSPASGASCGLELTGEGPFLVFATREDDGLAAGLCGGTAPWTVEAAAEVQMLTGSGTPAPGSAGTVFPRGPSRTTLEAGAAAVLAVVVGGLLLRRRGRWGGDARG